MSDKRTILEKDIKKLKAMGKKIVYNDDNVIITCGENNGEFDRYLVSEDGREVIKDKGIYESHKALGEGVHIFNRKDGKVDAVSISRKEYKMGLDCYYRKYNCEIIGKNGKLVLNTYSGNKRIDGIEIMSELTQCVKNGNLTHFKDPVIGGYLIQFHPKTNTTSVLFLYIKIGINGEIIENNVTRG